MNIDEAVNEIEKDFRGYQLHEKLNVIHNLLLRQFLLSFNDKVTPMSSWLIDRVKREYKKIAEGKPVREGEQGQ